MTEINQTQLENTLIKNKNKKSASLQLHKKGLLQGLFPNVNKVTA